MAIEIKKDAAVIATNAVVAVGIFVLVALKIIDWKVAMGALALLVTPSIAGAQRDASERTRDSDKDPPAPPPVLPLIITPMMLIFIAGCFPVDKGVEADVGYKLQQGACIDRNNTRAAIDACRDRVKAAWAADSGARGAVVFADAASPSLAVSDAGSDASEGGSK